MRVCIFGGRVIGRKRSEKRLTYHGELGDTHIEGIERN
jgi:hypothetical protein